MRALQQHNMKPHLITVYSSSRGSANTTWEIPKVSGKDEGFYECVASGNAGMGRAQTYLSISG